MSILPTDNSVTLEAPANPGRRLAFATVGLSVGFVCLASTKPAHAYANARQQPGDAVAAATDGAAAFAPNAFVRIDNDGSIRLVMPMVEMDQAIYTGSCMLLAEELGVTMSQIRVEHSPPNEALYGMPLLGGQITGGSSSTRSTWIVLHEAGAVARTLLVTAAATQWQKPTRLRVPSRAAQ